MISWNLLMVIISYAKRQYDSILIKSISLFFTALEWIQIKVGDTTLCQNNYEMSICRPNKVAIHFSREYSNWFIWLIPWPIRITSVYYCQKIDFIVLKIYKSLRKFSMSRTMYRWDLWTEYHCNQPRKPSTRVWAWHFTLLSRMSG